ncbi:MAG TPA: chloride channel protein [Acidimicrobiales bacterium]|nr:chloride channel protein [Acidimicrobiales bacterium]
MSENGGGRPFVMPERDRQDNGQALPVVPGGTSAAPEGPAPRRSGPRASPPSQAAAWLRGTRLGLVVIALVVGGVAGLGAVGFRWLIFSLTWLATGHQQFGQQGRTGSLHLPWLGPWFLLLIPVVGGLIYGPLIQRFAREARGHGVPEVMLAVAENGGRIRPPVSLVKALASAVCIGTGCSVGREGPIVQIGSAMASTLGQVVRVSETRLRVIVACGAAGGIAATFNAPITGLFFGFEIVLREFSLDALIATSLSAVAADLVSRAFFGSAPFFTGIPHDLSISHDYTYLLVVLLGLASGLVGYGFKTFLYKLEDVVDDLWKGRPEWARPAVGGIALGLLLFALPQMYGVGYPVMDQAIGGHIVLWLLLALMAGKVVAASLTLSIGGSGGVFAPSLFTGAMGGMAFGWGVAHLFGHIVSSPAVFGVIAMGAVFGAAAQAPLTAIASVLEMTGNFTLTLPVVLATGIAVAVSKQLTYGSIYTTKLLRRGIDIERPRPESALQRLTVANVMRPLTGADKRPLKLPERENGSSPDGTLVDEAGEVTAGAVTDVGPPQVLFADEDLAQTLRQLALYGRNGLPVLTPDGEHIEGWVTRKDVLAALAEQVASTGKEAERGTLATQLATDGGEAHQPTTPLSGYELVEVTIGPSSPARGSILGNVTWPEDWLVMAVTSGREVVTPRDDIELRAGERVILLAPVRRHDASSSADRPARPPSLREEGPG